MSKWKCEICNSSFENFDARGFDNKIYCPLCYYKKLYKDTELERERLKERIDEAIEYIENTYIGSILEVHSGYEEEYTKPLLDILKGSDKE